MFLNPKKRIELGGVTECAAQSLLVDVVKHQSASREGRSVDHIVHHRGPEREPARSHQCDLRLNHDTPRRPSRLSSRASYHFVLEANVVMAIVSATRIPKRSAASPLSARLAA